jgi:hypothetical protein
MLVINFFAGPGAGKSTLAAGTFYHLKCMDASLNVELVTEFAKELAWERRTMPISCQPYVFGEQLFRLHRLQEAGVDVVVTDSPLLLTLIYTPDYFPQAWNDTVKWQFNQFDNVNYMIKRTKKYNPNGRFQTEAQAVEKDKQTACLLNDNNIKYTEIEVTSALTVAQSAWDRLNVF